jgi:hypothetical protein
MINLHAFGGPPDVDILCDTICCAAERLMELAVGARTGLRHGQRWPDGLVQHDGYRGRDLETRSVDQAYSGSLANRSLPLTYYIVYQGRVALCSSKGLEHGGAKRLGPLVALSHRCST